MLVKMKFQMSGYRMVPDAASKNPSHEGYRADLWPEPGGVVDLPDDEAAALIRNGMAEEVPVERAIPVAKDIEKRATPAKSSAPKAKAETK